MASTNVFSHNSGGWKSKIKAMSGLVSGEDSPPWLADVNTVLTYSLSPHVAFSLCMLSPVFPLMRTPVLWDWGHTSMASFNFSYLLKGHISK